MKRIAIITARGGSKRIPKKNIKEFCGKPVLCRVIEAAQKAGIFDEIMVSTDSEEIAQVAREAGASVPFMRSEKTSDDYATTRDVLLEVLEEYKKRGKSFDEMCCLYPTAIFVTPDQIREGMEVLKKPNVASSMPVVRYSFPPQRSMVIRNGGLEYQWPENARVRSQDLEPIYHDVGQFYCNRIEDFLAESTDKINYPIIMDESQVQDIDTEEDWKIAEMKYRIMQELEEKS